MEDSKNNIDVPYLKDVATSTIVKEGYFSAEYMFWKEFLKNSKQLLPEFEQRADVAHRTGESTISWANLIPGCCPSKIDDKQQYLMALTWVHGCVSGICNHFKKSVDNLKALKSLADSVIYIRQQTLDKYGTEIDKAKDRVVQTHKQIEDTQRRIVEVKSLTREMHRRTENTCISSHEKRRMRKLEKDYKRATADLEKLRLDAKDEEWHVKQKDKDKHYRSRVLGFWRQIHSAILEELRIMDPETGAA